MSLSLFIARRINGQHDDRQKVSRPAIRIATAGVAIGLVVMIVTVAVVLGFKHTVSGKVIGFGSHVQIINGMSMPTAPDQPVCMNDSLMKVFGGIEGVRHVERYAIAQGILKTDDDFLGVMFKGIGPEYDVSFLKESLVEGELPPFYDAKTRPEVDVTKEENPYSLVVSKTMADKLKLKVGDRLFAYFIRQDDVRPLKFVVKAVYQTNMKRFDDVFCITDLYVPTRLVNRWRGDLCSGAELLVHDFNRLKDVNSRINEVFRKGRVDSAGNTLSSYTIQQVYPQVFQWLELFDINVWIILGLMVALAGFTMISGLLIIILERTQMIGVLKALGARNSMIRRTFLWFSAFIIGRGLLWGNIIGIGIVLIQQLTGIVRLDPQTYYVSEAPMELNLLLVLLLNVATLVVCILVLVGPSYLVSRIRPARSMRYE
ncbi:MAG: FtsX-like permease family protein [Prevotella sp.]|nr:FtsX-like permease family protein [Prevotella sp.]